jgi:hypothetical protein
MSAGIQGLSVGFLGEALLILRHLALGFEPRGSLGSGKLGEVIDRRKGSSIL